VKLLGFGLALLAIGLGLALFTYLSPVTPLMGGVLCTLLGALHVVSGGAGGGEPLDEKTITLGRVVQDDVIR
jgi:hypothetical protein